MFLTLRNQANGPKSQIILYVTNFNYLKRRKCRAKKMVRKSRKRLRGFYWKTSRVLNDAQDLIN